MWFDDDQPRPRKMVKDAVGRGYNGFQLRVELVEVPIETSKTSFNLRKKNWGKFYKTHFPWTLLYVVCCTVYKVQETSLDKAVVSFTLNKERFNQVS